VLIGTGDLARTRVSSSRAAAPFWLLIGAVAALYFGREIFIPLAFALTLALLLMPATAILQRLGFGRVLASLLPLVIVVAGLAASGWLVGEQLLSVTNQLPNYRDNIHAKIESIRGPSDGALKRAAESVQEIGKELSASGPAVVPPSRGRLRPQASGPVPVEVVEPPANSLTYLRQILGPFISPLAETFIVLIFSAFILIKREDLRNRVLRLCGMSQLNVMTQALDDAAQRVSRYLLLQILVNGCFGALFALGLWLIGVPYAALWGVIAAALRFVPYVGTPLATVCPLVLSLAVFDGWSKPAMVVAVFLGLELIVGNVVEPLLYGAHTGISSLAILVSAVFWAVVWGPAGLILSTPLTVCLVVAGRYVPQLSFFHILLGDEPVLLPEAKLYQRLLAMDQAEARAVVEEFRTGHSLVEVYDRVLIPALTMAEQDRHKAALEPAREEFILLSMSEMVAECADTARPLTTRDGRVLCLPAHDAADELTASMLAQVLEQAGLAVVSLPLTPSFQDVLAFIRPEPHDVICISALPPFAFSPARKLCRQIRISFPDVRIIVGLWGYAGDAVETTRRFEGPGPNQIATSLGGVLDLLGNSQTALTANAESAEPVIADSSVLAQ
jgi:predicted PurR-regulated permease PerM